MKKQMIIIATALLITAAIAGGTVALLSYSDDKKEKDTPDTSHQDKDPKEEPDQIVLDEGIDPKANEQAKAVEDEASRLMDTNPADAQKKYLEAEEAYRKAGNAFKSAEMRDNATTAEALIPVEEPEVAPPTPLMDTQN